MTFPKERDYDPEIAQATKATTSSDQTLPFSLKEIDIHSSSLQEGSTWYAKAHRYTSRFGVESRGIERVPSDERSTAGMSQIGTLWLSANMVVSSFALGALSYPVFYLGGEFFNVPMGFGKSEAGACLSFAASIFGFATGWTSYAADYTVYQPVNRSRKSIFSWTFAGLVFPLLFTEMLGQPWLRPWQPTAEKTHSKPTTTSSGIGGLLSSVLVPPLGRFGQFCIVVLALSIIANNCPNIYSVSLSLQVLSSATARVPRFAMKGLSLFLENFMLLIAYWLAIYEGIALSEHVFFKKGFEGYRPENYMDASRLPPGIAATVALLFGAMGAVLGMAQVWFTGPIGKLCGLEYGGDVGFELAFAFSAISYCGLRLVEIKKFGR
ncbi:hypothetical protein DID88_008717 [Monilinia fructigena]|uniref:Purine-cytosine permease n=1 Tax=Monilinia fructigena TaxID=38457 RepID=A0A395J8L8_9HELO|nr:hypothetical protein DID88_008717 [Monilinia fructigena]